MRSIELGWIARFDKSLPLPQLAFGPDNYHGGLYYSPRESERVIAGRYYDQRNGIIFISTTFFQDFAGNIAHEWRHHWQIFHGWSFNGAPHWNRPDDYDQAIIAYFSKSKVEADALRFQVKHAGCHERWKSLLTSAGFVFG